MFPLNAIRAVRIFDLQQEIGPSRARREVRRRALGYLPNTSPEPSGKSKLPGLIASEITDPYSRRLTQEFERLAVERGYEILVASSSHGNTRRRTSRVAAVSGLGLT